MSQKNVDVLSVLVTVDVLSVLVTVGSLSVLVTVDVLSVLVIVDVLSVLVTVDVLSVLVTVDVLSVHSGCFVTLTKMFGSFSISGKYLSTNWDPSSSKMTWRRFGCVSCFSTFTAKALHILSSTYRTRTCTEALLLMCRP